MYLCKVQIHLGHRSKQQYLKLVKQQDISTISPYGWERGGRRGGGIGRGEGKRKRGKGIGRGEGGRGRGVGRGEGGREGKGDREREGGEGEREREGGEG